MLKPGHLNDSIDRVLQKPPAEPGSGHVFTKAAEKLDKILNDPRHLKGSFKKGIRQKLLIFSVLILSATIFIGYSVYQNSQKLRISQRWVQHTEQVIYQSGNVLSLCREVEAAARGFVITQDSSYLHPLYTAEKTAGAYIQQLKQLTQDNPFQQQQIDSLNFYMQKRLNYSFKMAELRSNEGLASAITFTSGRQGKQYTDRIRQITNSIREEENDLLKKRKQVNSDSAILFNRLFVAMFILIVVFTVLLVIASAIYWVQLKHQDEIKQLNAKLGQKVIDRTANMDKYKYFFYNTRDLACFANAEGYFEELSENFTKVLGYTTHDLMGKKFFEFVHPDDVEPTMKVMEELSAGINVVNFINRFKSKSGNYKHLEWNAIYNLDNQKIYAIARDVTVVIGVNTEIAFHNKEEEECAEELIIANGELSFQNAEKGKRSAELIIANKKLAFQNEDKEKLAAELIIANNELVFQHQEKEKRALELVIANNELIFQNQEKEKRESELVAAIMELKKAEDDIRKLNEELEQKVIKRTTELESANKELESFSYSVSHDLRAPLRAVHGYARIFNEDYGAQFNTEAKRVMNNIINNSKKMGQLIDDLIAFSRLGRKELVKMNIPMHAMAVNLCEELKSEQDNRRIQIKINELEPALGDVVTIKQVWINLISNAFKYSKLKEEAIIEINSEVKGKEIIYSIKDNGAGFDMRYANKLFGVFQRLHSDEKFEGTGVGLAIVHRIISKHGGRTWAESKVNEGATFYFSLPKSPLA